MSPVVIVVWDGCRPDQVSWELTPNLMRLASTGTTLRESRSAYPPHTRVNCASLVTACWPVRHGLAGNTMLIPEIDAGSARTLADRATVRALAAARGGDLFDVPTLGRALADAGRSLCVVSAASQGSTSILGWQATAVIGDGFAEPAGLADRVGAACGETPGRADPGALNAYMTRVAMRFAVPELRPDVLLLWCCEPDVAHHRHGVGSAQARAAVAANDKLLGELLGCLDPDTHVMVLSDHGHSQVQRTAVATVDAIEALTGLRDGTDFVLATDAVYCGDSRDAVVAALREMPTIGPVFTASPHPDAMPASTVQLGGPWLPDVKYSHRSRGGVVLAGAEQDYRATHGTLSRDDLNNLFIAAGPAFRRGHDSTTPCGIVDVAPTVLRLLDVPAPAAWQGRVVAEALTDYGGAEPSVEHHLVELHGQEVRLATVGRTTYVLSGRIR